MAQKVPAVTNISLKALVDKPNNRVIFVEADNDFIDVLFGFMTIPMGKIVRLARDHSTPLEIGCLNKLYQSIEKLDVQVFRSNACRDMLLLPHSAADSHCKNLKIKVINNAEPTRYFTCSCYVFSNHSWLSYYAKVPCPSCSYAMSHEVYISVGDSQVGGVFVKERARVIITDDLQVIPPLSAASISLFTKLGATNSNSTEELTFSIEVEQVLNLLVSSLVSKTPFTETLLKHNPAPKFSSVNFNQGKCIESQMSRASINEEKENISVKLIIPDCPWKGCIDQLCKGFLDFDEKFFKSNHHKELLSNPKLVPGFCHENKLLGIEEAIYYCHHSDDSKMAADSSLFPANTSSGPVKLKVLDPKFHSDKDSSARGFLKGPAIFTVTDNLDVRPVSATFQLSVLNDLKVSFNDIEDRTVLVGKKEALCLLVASFVSNSALTNAFLREPKELAIN